MSVRAVLVDYGGVLTTPLQDAMASWCEADGIDAAGFGALMREWLTPGAPVNPVHELETGRLPGPEFERLLAERLRARDGSQLTADGLLGRMFAGFREEPTMTALLLAVRRAGLLTGLLSNSWANDYPRDAWDALFDAVVISGEVGLRKPDPRIYRLAAERLGVLPAECVFIDDLAPNVAAAARVGMIGVRHVDAATTHAEFEAILGRRLTLPAEPAAARPGE